MVLLFFVCAFQTVILNGFNMIGCAFVGVLPALTFQRKPYKIALILMGIVRFSNGSIKDPFSLPRAS